MRENVPTKAQWMTQVMTPYSIVTSPCNRVRVAILGLLSDEPGIFRDNTFKGVPIGNVVETYTSMYKQLVPQFADTCVALTHQSIYRDRELAAAMLELHGGKGIIIGGHGHEPLDEVVGHEGTDDGIRILKSGTDAMAASLIDLSFDVKENELPVITNVDYSLEPLVDVEPSEVVQQIVDKHMSVIKALEDEAIIDGDTSHMLPPGSLLSSKRVRFEQTTVGSIFLQMIKEEMDSDVAILNGATIKGGKEYQDGKMTYAELKKELPFPTKMIVVLMRRWELQDAIDYSRNAHETGSDQSKGGERRAYLQVDWDYDQFGYLGSPDDELKVALPRNLLQGFCNIIPLMNIGERLEKENISPGPNDFVPAIDLVMRHACKNRWSRVISDIDDFDLFDLNADGVLDRHEIKMMLEKFLGHEPADFVVDDMIAALDDDENGVIDKGELSFLLAKMEREQNWRKF
jgi:2',3'-cyclic-nucleotide 2'-phosphodiesterase (5'-nucleotidase family)